MEWMDSLTSPSAFFAASTFAAIFGIIPTATFAVAAGATFGLFWGMILYISSATLGAVICYVLCSLQTLRGRILKYVGKDYLEKIKGFKVAVKNEGPATISSLVRLSPVMPFAISSAILAFVEVPLGPFCLGTFAGLIPSSLPYVYMGFVGQSSTSDDEEWDVLGLSMTLVGLVATIALTWKVTKIASSALDRASKE